MSCIYYSMCYIYCALERLREIGLVKLDELVICGINRAAYI